ncbi:uncharacterized protein LOC126901653 isoform X1 [Daktulosphaira vitifoliae]|uniref:uncharacterized protein LOC126901652 isoform X1 n=2 Tax=Daktulosphaira vitifoliae TaxID=58002 RepID=UPI0021AA8A29|nr:uncharacterized protein LOC126901652 isoform X1 [Daktulosphaira vitifoliae]XP_050534246.1 uncharacterized protein LOC126901652 isoform X1 [Daktulosphaira vitifoliae]XP_050534247.1 uncharacterized protein LOC126901652 isoform X1 [Daktulosphaira vitifoliae]XP_050534251.1 uncharacterized protein LOC126901653 isoform X1 [Daktulosphaira vitifoliae]
MSSTTSQISDFNLLRKYGKRSSKKNNSTISDLYNNLYSSQMVATIDQKNKMSPQRTISLGSLHHASQTQYMEPRLTQLETLEAKMANIEVSLSTTLKKPKKSFTPIIPNNSQPTPPPTVIHGSQKNTTTPTKTMNGYMLKSTNNNYDKENFNHNTISKSPINQNHLVSDIHTNEENNNKNNLQFNNDIVNDSEKLSLTQKINNLKNDIDQKRLAIKNIKISLDQLDVTDNIDTRIQQAELEYQLGREELNLLSLMEEINKNKCRLEEVEHQNEKNENNTLYNYLSYNPDTVISLRAIEIEFDLKSPKFGVGPRKDKPGLFIDWTLDGLGFSKGDRLLEVNGKVVLLMKKKEDLNRLLEVSPGCVRIVVMKNGPTVDQLELVALKRELDECRAQAEEVDRSRHAYKTDNVRLSHRVSYLEDQISELMKTRSSAASVLFQRGSNSAMVRSKSPKHGVSAIQQYKRKQQLIYDDRPVLDGPVKTRIRTVPRLYGSSASVESLVSTSDVITVAPKSFDDLQAVSPKRISRCPPGRSSRTRHIREAQQTLFRFLDSESSGSPYLPQMYASSSGSVRSLDLEAVDHQRLKSNEYYSHLTAGGNSLHPSRSLNYDSENSGGRRPMPPKKPLRLSLQQRQKDKEINEKRHHRNNSHDEIDLSIINNTMSQIK